MHLSGSHLGGRSESVLEVVKTSRGTADRHTWDIQTLLADSLNLFLKSQPYRATGAGPRVISRLSPILHCRLGPAQRQEGRTTQWLSGSEPQGRILAEIVLVQPWTKHTPSQQHQLHIKHAKESGVMVEEGTGGLQTGDPFRPPPGEQPLPCGAGLQQ